MYMMLTMWCLGIVVWHIPTWKQGIKLSALNSILLFLLVMAGFLTHYYYAVFLFFLAAYTCLYNWWGRKDFKGSFLYGCVVCLGMVAAISALGINAFLLIYGFILKILLWQQSFISAAIAAM